MLKSENGDFTLSEDKTAEYYHYGDPQPNPNANTNTISQENYINKYISTSIFTKLNTAQHNHLSVKDNKTAVALWGTKVHYYLSKVYQEKDIQVVMELIRRDVTINNEVKENLLKVMENIFFHSLSSILFGHSDSEIRNEVELIDAEGKSYRIDRLRIDKEKCIVIDYKTGVPNDSHSTQINQYKDLLSAIGYEVTNKYLVYIDDTFQVNFHEVSPEVSPE
jgi:ATP-dependent exoDNAse (exonuclease V) beta subunit